MGKVATDNECLKIPGVLKLMLHLPGGVEAVVFTTISPAVQGAMTSHRKLQQVGHLNSNPLSFLKAQIFL